MSPRDLTHWISPSILALEREKENVEQILENIKMKSAQTPMSLLGFRWKVQDHWPNLAVLWLAEAVSETEKTWPCKPMVQHNIHAPGPPALNKCTENPLLAQLMPLDLENLWKLQRVFSSLAAGLLWHCLTTVTLITISFQLPSAPFHMLSSAGLSLSLWLVSILTSLTPQSYNYRIQSILLHLGHSFQMWETLL